MGGLAPGDAWVVRSAERHEQGDGRERAQDGRRLRRRSGEVQRGCRDGAGLVRRAGGRTLALALVPVALMAEPVVVVALDGNERVMDRMDRAVETVDSDHEGRGQERHEEGPGRSEQT